MCVCVYRPDQLVQGFIMSTVHENLLYCIVYSLHGRFNLECSFI